MKKPRITIKHTLEGWQVITKAPGYTDVIDFGSDYGGALKMLVELRRRVSEAEPV